MIPVLQLDPSTLSLFADLELIAAGPDGLALAGLMERMVFGKENVVPEIQALEDPGLSTRAAYLASCVWHEKRHFIDLVLSNYGAFRIRQYFTLYLNTTRILQECRAEKRPVVLPLDAASDAFRLKILGLDSVGENLKLQACNVRDRKKMLADDRRPVDTFLGPIEVGGEAQLEALAYLTQTVALQEHFGLDVTANVHQDIPDMANLNQKYRWAMFMGHIWEAVPRPRGFKENSVLMDANLLSAMLLGSLSCRMWKQEQTRIEGQGSSYLPSERLAGLLGAFKGRGAEFENVTPAGAWEAVNDAAKRLWGRNILEEIEADYACEEDFVNRCRTVKYEVPEAVFACLEDFHRLRGALIAFLRQTPEMFVNLSSFVEALLPLADPMPILAKPSGQEGDVPEGWERVWGFQETSPEGEKVSWWWAITPGPKGKLPIALKESAHWLTLTSNHAPLAKLMMNGFSHRTILGPELLFGSHLLHRYGIDIKIDPLFRFPPDFREAAFYWKLTGRPEARCDLCKSVILKNNGFVLSPWVWRKSSELSETAIALLGGGTKGHYRFLRDWSVWVICDTCEDQYVVRES